MLVLSRRINESIQIGTDIEVMVIDVRGDIVRIGINAPQSTQIWRKELWDVIVSENRKEQNLRTLKTLRSCRSQHSRSYQKFLRFAYKKQAGIKK